MDKHGYNPMIQWITVKKASMTSISIEHQQSSFLIVYKPPMKRFKIESVDLPTMQVSRTSALYKHVSIHQST